MQAQPDAVARALTDIADAELLRELAAIAADRSQPTRLRTIAAAAAMAFRTWLRWRTRVPTRRMALYGRYCGPGYSGPGEPVDIIDAACRRHDRAYQAAADEARKAGCFEQCAGEKPTTPHGSLLPWLQCLQKCNGKKPKPKPGGQG